MQKFKAYYRDNDHKEQVYTFYEKDLFAADRAAAAIALRYDWFYIRVDPM